MSIKTKGLDELQRSLEDLQNRVEELDGEHQVSLSELFPDFFMIKNTNFYTISEMFDKSGFKIETPEDFAAIPDDEWDKYIQENTQFDSWQEMQEAAAQEYFTKKLGFEAGDDE